MKRRAITGAIEIQVCPEDGQRRAHVLQTDGAWIRADLCECISTFGTGGSGMQFSPTCPIDRHAIRARGLELDGLELAPSWTTGPTEHPYMGHGYKIEDYTISGAQPSPAAKAPEPQKQPEKITQGENSQCHQ